jgi:hypothetical protein
MASIAISAVTALINGGNAVTGATAASADTITVTAPSGASLDLSRLAIRLYASAGSTAGINIGVSTTYSSESQGVYSFTITSSETVYIGGEDFESARFLTQSAQSVVITQSGACAINAEAVLLPGGFTA